MAGRGASLGTLSILLAAAIGGCLGTDDEIPVDAPSGTHDATMLAAYLHDVTPLDPALKVVDGILEHLRVPAPDGILLDTWIVRPDIPGPVPLVLEVTPYYAGGPLILDNVSDPGKHHRLGRLGDWLVPRGYAVGVSSVRGTGTSEGCFTQGGPQEGKDTAAVIEHLAAQSWSNGNVGVIGVSYPGTTPQDVWIEAPPSLKTIVPIAGISDFYKYNFVNGVPIYIQGLGFNSYYWALAGAMPYGPDPDVVYDVTNVPASVLGEACTDQIDVQQGGISATIDGNKDGYWQVRDFTAELLASWDRNAERASVFYIHGLQDWNVKPHMMEGWLPAIQESGVPYKVWLGQWSHNWPQREDWWNTTLAAWFDQFLKGIDTGILDAPPVQVQDDLGRWRHESTWPPLEVETTVLYPNGAGRLEGSPGSGDARYRIDGAPTSPTPLPHPLDQAPTAAVFVSEPVDEEMVLAGLPRFVGNATANGQRASLILSLGERYPDGTERMFNYAALSLNHAHDLASGSRDITGVRVPFDLSFFPQDDVITKGNRIVLYASADIVGVDPGPSLIPIEDARAITLHLDGARLELPVDRTVTLEDPQPCWEGVEKVARGEAEHACYLIGRS